MADISEYLRNSQVKGPRRKKRNGAHQSLWAEPTLASLEQDSEEKNGDIELVQSQLGDSEESSQTSKKSVDDQNIDQTILADLGSIKGSGGQLAQDFGVAQAPLLLDPLMATQKVEDSLSLGKKLKRTAPVTVGRPTLLPAPPKEFDFEKDERFLTKYWMSPGPGGVPRSQERFFNFYRYLYSEACKTKCARVYCTEPMATEVLGPKARGTFSSYRKLGAKYGLFQIHIVSNLGNSGHNPGTYFYLRDPWKSQ